MRIINSNLYEFDETFGGLAVRSEVAFPPELSNKTQIALEKILEEDHPNLDYIGLTFESIMKENSDDFKAYRAYPIISNKFTPMNQEAIYTIKIPRENNKWKINLESQLRTRYLEPHKDLLAKKYDDDGIDYAIDIQSLLDEKYMSNMSRIIHVDDDKEFMISKYMPGIVVNDLNKLNLETLSNLAYLVGNLNSKSILFADFHDHNIVVDEKTPYLIDHLSFVKTSEPGKHNHRDLMKLVGSYQDTNEGADNIYNIVDTNYNRGYNES